jgi:hypothetical protein
MPIKTTSAGFAPRSIAPRSVPSIVPPIATASRIAARFHAGTNAWMRIISGCSRKNRSAAARYSAAGVERIRRESRMCAMATTWLVRSKMMTPFRVPFAHTP